MEFGVEDSVSTGNGQLATGKTVLNSKSLICWKHFFRNRQHAICNRQNNPKLEELYLLEALFS
jgi:hypothetical protein